ncbi:MAG: hypothetical protein ACRD3S_07290, partial [Terracidiphilus sp.]
MAIHSSDFLVTLADLGVTFGADSVVAVEENLLKLRSYLGGTSIVAGANIEVEQAFECGRVPRSPFQNCFEQDRRFLSQAITRKEIDVSERLG